MIVKMADNWPPPNTLHSWTPYLSHLLPDCFQISYMDYFYQTLTQVWIWALSANQDGLQNGRNLSVSTCGHFNLVIYHPISQVPNFILNSFIIHWPNFEYGFCLTNDNYNGHQNGRLWSVCICGNYFSHLTLISSKFHIWTTFLKLLFISEYRFCLVNIIKILRWSPKLICPFDHRPFAGPLVGVLTVLVITSHDYYP